MHCFTESTQLFEDVIIPVFMRGLPRTTQPARVEPLCSNICSKHLDLPPARALDKEKPGASTAMRSITSIL